VLAIAAVPVGFLLPRQGAATVVRVNDVAAAPHSVPATDTDLTPNGLTVDSHGNVYIADFDAKAVDEVTSSGRLSIVAGHGDNDTGGPAISSRLLNPAGVAVDGTGNLYIADSGKDAVVEKVTPSGNISIVAGVPGHFAPPVPGPATRSNLLAPSQVALDSSTGDLYIADSLHAVVEKVTPSGTLSIVAGVSATFGPPIPGPATSSYLYFPSGVAIDSVTGNLYIADSGNQVVEKVTPSGTLSIVAGKRDQNGPPTAGLATSSQLGDVTGLALDSLGNLYIADPSNNVVEKVTQAGDLSVVAGSGLKGRPTPGQATSSALNGPSEVAVDSIGNLYIADTSNNVVEKVSPSGTLSIFAGKLKGK
jgi:sugar lactone lactonase YvrE